MARSSAALVWMTNFGMVEKGRLIEIEALYASLTGLAFICWLSWWQEQRSRWLTWTVPWIFLGLGMLAKGPLHLVFFYAVVVVGLVSSRRAAGALESRASLGPSAYARPLRGLGDSVLAEDARQRGCACLDAAVLRATDGRGFQFRWMDFEHSARAGVFSSLDIAAAVCAEKRERRTSNVERRTG